MTQEEFDALQPGDRVMTTDTHRLAPDEQLQPARVYGIEGVGIGRIVVLDFDDGRRASFCMPTSLDRMKDNSPLPLPG